MKPYTVVYILVYGSAYRKVSVMATDQEAALRAAKVLLLKNYPLTPFDLVAIAQAESDSVCTFKVWRD